MLLLCNSQLIALIKMALVGGFWIENNCHQDIWEYGVETVERGGNAFVYFPGFVTKLTLNWQSTVIITGYRLN